MSHDFASRRSYPTLTKLAKFSESFPLVPAVRLIWRQTRSIASSDRSVRAARVFLLRSLLAPRSVAAWIDFLDEYRRRRGLGSPRHDLLTKPLRNYGCLGLSIAQRVEILQVHHRAAAAALLPIVIDSLWSGGTIELAAIEGRSGTRYRLWIGPALTSRQEGELAFVLTEASPAAVLATLTFCISNQRHCDDAVLLIGGLQGPPAGIDKRRIVFATRDLCGLRPKMAVFVALQAFADRTRCAAIKAVSNRTHVGAGKAHQRRKRRANYDGFWQERGGVSQEGGFLLPVRVMSSASGRQLRHRRNLIDAVDRLFGATPRSEHPRPEMEEGSGLSA